MIETRHWTDHLDVWERGGAFVIAWIDGDTFLGTFKDRVSAERSLDALRETVKAEEARLTEAPRAEPPNVGVNVGEAGRAEPTRPDDAAEAVRTVGPAVIRSKAENEAAFQKLREIIAGKHSGEGSEHRGDARAEPTPVEREALLSTAVARPCTGSFDRSSCRDSGSPPSEWCSGCVCRAIAGPQEQEPSREPEWKAPPREGRCMFCEREYPTWFAPNAEWNRVMRRGDGSDRWPFICPTCYAIKVTAAGQPHAIFELRLSEPGREPPRESVPEGLKDRIAMEAYALGELDEFFFAETHEEMWKTCGDAMQRAYRILANRILRLVGRAPTPTEPSEPSEPLREAEQALARLDARRDEDLNEWAERLGHDLAATPSDTAAPASQDEAEIGGILFVMLIDAGVERPSLGGCYAVASTILARLSRTEAQERTEAINEANDRYRPHVFDLYEALGVKWGDDPFPVIKQLRAGRTEALDVEVIRRATIEECARIADDCDKSKHPADVADRIRRLSTPASTEATAPTTTESK